LKTAVGATCKEAVMSVSEMRFLAVFGMLLVGVVAIGVGLAVVHLSTLARHLKNGIVRNRALPSLRGDTRDVARLIDRRQAAGRLRC
jgi:ABC-type nickel/cobalt efflux system permease component RcnA